MKLVCDLIYAKKLKELGVKQDSLFYYCNDELMINNPHKFCVINQDVIVSPSSDSDTCKIIEHYSAFNSEELIEMLPKTIKGNELKISYLPYCEYENEISRLMYFESDKRVNSLAKCLIWCIENEYMEVK